MLLSLSGTRFTCAFCLLLAICFSCNKKEHTTENSLVENRVEIPLSFAHGFSLYSIPSGYLLEIRTENGNKELFLVHHPEKVPAVDIPGITAAIPMGSKNIVLTATTQIPHLTYLNAAERLIAFPNLDLISSPTIRKRIANDELIELGRNPMPDMEKIIAAEPDWVMVSGFGEVLQLADRLKAAKIPVLVNGEFLETHPLGKSEWIKATGALLGKLDEADSIFSHIEDNYLSAAKNTASLPKEKRPTVLSGTLYKDVWYAPGKDSWMARLIHDAGGNYVFRDLEGSGSLTLNYEYVLERAREASLSIGAADFSSLTKMGEQNSKYKNFRSFLTNEVYTYTLKKGETGGLMYFEEGYLRPDWVLQDMIKIVHPEKSRDQLSHYFQRLDE